MVSQIRFGFLTVTLYHTVEFKYTKRLPQSKMPYIIYTPSNPHPFITNNPIIYMDARTWGWKVESRPFHDDDCKEMVKREEQRFEAERRAMVLETAWGKEVQRRKDTKETDIKVPGGGEVKTPIDGKAEKDHKLLVIPTTEPVCEGLGMECVRIV
jgi:hypothetical protein